MKNILENREVLRPFVFQIVTAVLSALYCYFLDSTAGIICFISSVLLISVFFINTCRRYKKIAELSESLDRILHGDHKVQIDDYSEGELAILQCEIYKMTVHLRQNAENLVRDKKYLSDSLADISHQIRTPLTSINLMLELLSDSDLKAEQRKVILRELKGMVSGIDWLITTLLKISKLDAGRVELRCERMPMEKLIKRAVSPLVVPVELKGQDIIINASGDFIGDPSWTAEALCNIVKNCMEHTPCGGIIEILSEENPIYSEIVIKDSGNGIHKEDLPHIFERFYKGINSDSKSYGVGLALAKTIINLQNGTIRAENAENGGAVFKIRFYNKS